MYRDRVEAGRRLAALLRARAAEHPFASPLVLGIPRGGVVVGAAVARDLDAELDVVLARKLRAEHQPELAVGAIGEDGSVYLNPEQADDSPEGRAHLERERAVQSAEIFRRAAAVRAVRPAAPIEGRTVIVVDDGLATGSTMIAALRALRGRAPRELIVAVPVAPSETLDAVRPHCDAVVCPWTPTDFHAIGQFYRRFDAVDEAEMLALLRGNATSPSAGTPR